MARLSLDAVRQRVEVADTLDEESTTGRRMSLDVARGYVTKPPSFWEFLKDPKGRQMLKDQALSFFPSPSIDNEDPEAVARLQKIAAQPQKEALKYVAGTAASAADILPATVGMLANIPGRAALIGGSKGSGESWGIA